MCKIFSKVLNKKRIQSNISLPKYAHKRLFLNFLLFIIYKLTKKCSRTDCSLIGIFSNVKLLTISYCFIVSLPIDCRSSLIQNLK